MSKFRLKMKLEGFELEIEGSREDASIIGRNIGQQMASMMMPASRIIEGEIEDNAAPQIAKGLVESTAAKKSKRRRSTASSEKKEGAAPIDFKHDASTYGNPSQACKGAQKAIWLIYVVKSIGLKDQMSARVVTETFNKHFKQAGLLDTSIVSRDLGRLKTKSSPAAVSEDTTQSPSEWFLTNEGDRLAKELIDGLLSG